jgi:glycosyltransferase involved in cell wall biosynthesis
MISWLLYGCLVLLMAPLAMYVVCLRIYPRTLGSASPILPVMEAVSIIVPCYNEEQQLERKVQEILAECQASNITNFEIILISDGSTDQTNTVIAKLQAHQHVRSLLLAERMGKANAVNLGMAQASHDWVILSDVRQTIQSGAFQQLLAHFADPSVGAVSAKLDHRDPSWVRRCINLLKLQENKPGSTVGVYGALYALKKSCFVPIPTNTILDDLLIALHVLRAGKRVVFEPRAVVVDIEIDPFYGRERTLRIINGLWQLWVVHAKTILALQPRHVVFLGVQKYYKFYFPPLCVATACLGFWEHGFDSLTTQIAGIALLTAGVAACLFGYPKLRFAARLLHFSMLSIIHRKRHNTVLWPKPK